MKRLSYPSAANAGPSKAFPGPAARGRRAGEPTGSAASQLPRQPAKLRQEKNENNLCQLELLYG